MLSDRLCIGGIIHDFYQLVGMLLLLWTMRPNTGRKVMAKVTNTQAILNLSEQHSYYRIGWGLRAAKYPRIWLLNYSHVKCLSFVRSIDWTPETSAVLTFMSRPKDVKNAKFCAESNGCVGGFWYGLNGVSISAILVFLYLIVYCPALMPRQTLSPNQYGRASHDTI